MRYIAGIAAIFVGALIVGSDYDSTLMGWVCFAALSGIIAKSFGIIDYLTDVPMPIEILIERDRERNRK